MMFNLHMLMMLSYRYIVRIVLLACLSVSTSVYAVVPPKTLNYDGKTFTLVFKNVAPDGEYGIYKYTLPKETVKNWTELMTINYRRGATSTPYEWISSIKQTLDQEKPVPHYDMGVEGSKGFAVIIYAPTPTDNMFEANVHIGFPLTCGGIVILQYARHYPNDRPDAAKQTLVRAVADMKLQLNKLTAYKWVPACQP